MWDNLADRDFYHVLVAIHDIVFFRIAGVLCFFFCCIVLLFDVAVADDVVALRIVVQPLRLLILVSTECVGRLEYKFPVHQHSVVWATFCYIDIRRLYLLLQMKIGGTDFWNFVAEMMKSDSLLRISFDTDTHHVLVAGQNHYTYTVRIVRTLDSVYH